MATAADLKTQDDRNLLARDLAAFNRMYASHEAEDTVLFPEPHKIVLKHEYGAMKPLEERASIFIWTRLPPSRSSLASMT
jgi:hypothetical protein